MNIILALAKYPEVQQKAQQELDEVVGDRLPNFDDRDSLPYIDALIYESLRWNPSLPAGKYALSSEHLHLI